MTSDRYRVSVLRPIPDRPGLTRWEEIGAFPTPEAARAAAGPSGRVHHQEADGRWRELMDDVPPFVRAAETKARGILAARGIEARPTRYGWAVEHGALGEPLVAEVEAAEQALRAGNRYRHAMLKSDHGTATEALGEVAILSAWFAAAPSRESKASRRLGGRNSKAGKQEKRRERDEDLIAACAELWKGEPGLSIPDVARLVFKRHAVAWELRSVGQVEQRMRRAEKAGFLKKP